MEPSKNTVELTNKIVDNAYQSLKEVKINFRFLHIYIK